MMELDYGMLSPRFGRSDFTNYGFGAEARGYGGKPENEAATITSLTIKPAIATKTIMFMLEAITVRVELTLQPPVANDELICAELVTNLIHQDNPDGGWQHIPMDLERSQYHIHTSDVTYSFKTTILCTSEGKFEFTARIRNEKGAWIWISSYGENAVIDVLPPSPDSKWTHGPQANEVAPNLFVGNFIAANTAASLGFTAVLNMAEELDPVFQVVPNTPPVLYKKISVPGMYCDRVYSILLVQYALEFDRQIFERTLYNSDGASNPIPTQAVAQAVDWIEQQIAKGHKVLVHCRAGIGRSGSIGMAYIYKQNKTWSYDQVRKFIWTKKPDVYPHKNLYETLSRLYPRELKFSPQS